MAIYNGRLSVVDFNETKRYAGLGKSKDFPHALISDACLEAQITAVPRGSYLVYDYNCDQACISSSPPLLLTGQKIKAHLQGAVKVAVMAVTIGCDLENTIHAHFAQGRYSAAVLLDAAGTTAVEAVADQLNALIDDEAAKLGYKPTKRFSPGYGDWDIRVQPDIVHLADGIAIGVKATETAMLEPRKSVTALIGFIPKGDYHGTPYTANNQNTDHCQTCNQINCQARKT